MNTIPILSINMNRLKHNIIELSSIGKHPEQGIYRMAFTDADMQAREWLKSKITDAGLEFSQDGAANMFGRLFPEKKETVVMMGSHIDTVPGAGHLDGSLGVLVALECLQRIHEENMDTIHPMEMVSFSDEEGRFGGLFGSQAFCGLLNPDTIHSAMDLDGIRLEEAMHLHGLNAMDALEAFRQPEEIHSYLELHIEQGPVLDNLGKPVGIVEDITGLFKWSIRLVGDANHAGTTPMPMRRDAFQGLAEFSSEIPRVLEEYGSEHSVATIGKVELTPGAANTVPGLVEFSLDVRDTAHEVLQQLADAFRRVISAIARRRQLMFEFDILSEVLPRSCNTKIVKSLLQTCDTLGIDGHRMPSGAAHDAQILAGMIPVGMIFVASQGGRSHSPAEWSHWHDIETGANLALNTIAKLAYEKE